mmetsp:Transcript_36783/g.101156  ORF Transcript_36783/g.101156 Transcript_36783/m.101156 type:complete len:625 (+) Transcript_36783:67-1941(+)
MTIPEDLLTVPVDPSCVATDCSLDCLLLDHTSFFALFQTSANVRDRMFATLYVEPNVTVIPVEPSTYLPLQHNLPLQFLNAFFVIFGAVFSIYCILLLGELLALARLYSNAGHATEEEEEEEVVNRKEPWSTLSIMGLCSFRLYTGFLSATWLPYLLALEGQALWEQNQSLFMAVVKLIYALTIMLEPLLGFFDDRIVEKSYGLGRRLSLRCGVALGCIGIFICLYAGPRLQYWMFMLGITIWRIGEAMNDVTIEALTPELLPASQFQKASAIKAGFFLVGGLAGYVAVLFSARLHYTWTYYAYLTLKIPLAIPTFMLVSNDAPGGAKKSSGLPWWQDVWNMYKIPGTFEGGFPRLSLASCVYMCGTAPVFFLILFIRDLVGVMDPVDLQLTLAWTSIVFFAIAGVSAGSTGGGGAQARLDAVDRKLRSHSPDDLREADADWQAEKISRIRIMVRVMIASSFCILALPLVRLFEDLQHRLQYFFVVVVFIGVFWGQAYARFQDITWRLLPEDGVDVGNAMGYSVMLRNAGTGFGNFVSGLVLDCFPAAGHPSRASLVSLFAERHRVAIGEPLAAYTILGYTVVCVMCTYVTLMGSYAVHSIPDLIEREKFARMARSGDTGSSLS